MIPVVMMDEDDDNDEVGGSGGGGRGGGGYVHRLVVIGSATVASLGRSNDPVHGVMVAIEKPSARREQRAESSRPAAGEVGQAEIGQAEGGRDGVRDSRGVCEYDERLPQVVVGSGGKSIVGVDIGEDHATSTLGTCYYRSCVGGRPSGHRRLDS